MGRDRRHRHSSLIMADVWMKGQGCVLHQIAEDFVPAVSFTFKKTDLTQCIMR